jgi:hypothetical protein
VLGEGVGQRLGELQLGEVVAICDHLGLLGRGELKHEVLREALGVALDLLVQPLGVHAVQRSQVGVDDHLLIIVVGRSCVLARPRGAVDRGV